MRRSPAWAGSWRRWPSRSACSACSRPYCKSLPGRDGGPWWVGALAVCLVLTSAGLGLLVAVPRPGHPAGALLLAGAVILGAAGAAIAFGLVIATALGHPFEAPRAAIS